MLRLLCCRRVEAGGEFNTLGDLLYWGESLVVAVTFTLAGEVVSEGFVVLLDVLTLGDAAKVGEVFSDENTLGDGANVGEVFIEAFESRGNGSMR